MTSYLPPRLPRTLTSLEKAYDRYVAEINAENARRAHIGVAYKEVLLLEDFMRLHFEGEAFFGHHDLPVLLGELEREAELEQFLPDPEFDGEPDAVIARAVEEQLMSRGNVVADLLGDGDHWDTDYGRFAFESRSVH